VELEEVASKENVYEVGDKVDDTEYVVKEVVLRMRDYCKK
jgi:hypothetical protein